MNELNLDGYLPEPDYDTDHFEHCDSQGTDAPCTCDDIANEIRADFAEARNEAMRCY